MTRGLWALPSADCSERRNVSSALRSVLFMLAKLLRADWPSPPLTPAVRPMPQSGAVRQSAPVAWPSKGTTPPEPTV